MALCFVLFARGAMLVGWLMHYFYSFDYLKPIVLSLLQRKVRALASQMADGGTIPANDLGSSSQEPRNGSAAFSRRSHLLLLNTVGCVRWSHPKPGILPILTYDILFSDISVYCESYIDGKIIGIVT